MNCGFRNDVLRVCCITVIVICCVQSALGREQELEAKLASMQSVLNIARELATDSMIVSSSEPPSLPSLKRQ